MKKYLIVLLALLFALTFTACNNSTNSAKITSIELEKPKTETEMTEIGYALFADNTYSAGKTFVTRGYINNSSSYSYINATIKAKKTLNDDSTIITIGSDYKFETNEIYTVWAEYNGLKSKSYDICAYEANSIFKATITDRPIEIGKSLSDVKKYIYNVQYFDDSGKIQEADDASKINNLKVMLYDTKNDKALMLDNSTNLTDKGYNLLYAYTDSTNPFVMVKEVDIFNPNEDFNSIAIYNNTYSLDNGLSNMQYAKRYNGTTIPGRCTPFSSGSDLKADHYITISDGITETKYEPGETVNYAFEAKVKYTITLKVKNGDKFLTTTRNIMFYK